ncbi:MAG: hypothetical protein SO253_03770 [Bacilli bacterium]|nr:hypothetical protein [Bacilli bacterium]
MFQTINFDIIFAIVLITLLICSVFKNSRKIKVNFVLMFFSLLIVGCLSYFKAIDYLVLHFGNFFNKVIGYIPDSLVNENTYGILYYIILLLSTLVIFGFFKLLGLLIRTENYRYKEDPTYVTLHSPVSAIFVTFFKCLIIMYLFVTLIVLLNPILQFDFANSYVIEAFNRYDVLVKYLLDKGNSIFMSLI